MAHGGAAVSRVAWLHQQHSRRWPRSAIARSPDHISSGCTCALWGARACSYTLQLGAMLVKTASVKLPAARAGSSVNARRAQKRLAVTQRHSCARGTGAPSSGRAVRAAAAVRRTFLRNAKCPRAAPCVRVACMPSTPNLQLARVQRQSARPDGARAPTEALCACRAGQCTTALACARTGPACLCTSWFSKPC